MYKYVTELHGSFDIELSWTNFKAVCGLDCVRLVCSDQWLPSNRRK